MLFKRRSLVLVLMGTLIASTAVQPMRAVASERQQRHVVDGSEMDVALARSAAAAAKDREAIRELFRDQRVERIAESLGLQIATADAAISALEGDELVRLADGARAAEIALAGGQSVTLTYGAIIIILLVVIILILIA